MMIEIINKITNEHFSVVPTSIVRFEIGLCNEVYKVTLPNKDNFVFRLNTVSDSLRSSDRYIPIFKNLGLKVPTIIISDYSKKIVPYCFQILNFIPGKDIGRAFSNLTKPQIRGIAGEIANIFKKTRTLPTDGTFGNVDFTGHGPFKSWTDSMQHEVNLAIDAGHHTGTLIKEIEDILLQIFRENINYFRQVESKSYYDDIAAKNVLIEKGQFSGLIDLDGIHFGDYLEAVGRIKADFVDRGEKGEFYISCVEDELKLDHSERKMVTIYALLNRIFWSTGNGVKFNQNSNVIVDKKRIKRDHATIKQLNRMLDIEKDE